MDTFSFLILNVELMYLLYISIPISISLYILLSVLSFVVFFWLKADLFSSECILTTQHLYQYWLFAFLIFQHSLLSTLHALINFIFIVND